MHQNEKLVQARIDRVLNERIVPAVYSQTAPVTLRAWEVGGEPVPFDEAAVAPFTSFSPGTPWGSAWSTWWFEVSGAIPTAFAGRTVELLLDPGFTAASPGFQAEGLVFTPDGRVVKGIHPRNRYVRLSDAAAGGETFRYLVEFAANPDILAHGFTPTPYGDRTTAPTDPLFRFVAADVAVFEPEVWGLRFDVEVLNQLMLALPEPDPRRHEILRTLERSLDALRLDDIVGTAATARAVLAPALTSPANASAHQLSAIGHAHIDSAWLWPVRETKRKTGRTFSNVVALAEDYPELKFACSSAQQYQWVQERYPDVFARIKDAIATGHWVPVGSQWVEADGNLPGGEALVRQLTQALRYFRAELGVDTHGVWLPDSFGYTAAYPQIAKQAGLTWFLTQKISWNQTNTFPHHSFWWEGIDGSRIFTHFPPVDTYNSTLEGSELAHAVGNFRDKGRATTSLVPFGYGDGGGGPVREMMERARRTRSLEGSPRVEIEHPDDFFARAEAEYPDAPVWVGELYLELHRGTFTSHAHEKRNNRAAEHRLREVELWATTAAVLAGAPYPYDELDQLWQTTLLQQFHDILPGSAIAWVYRENAEEYARSFIALERLTGEALTALGADGTVANVAPHARTGLIEDAEGAPLALVHVPGGSLAPIAAVPPAHPVTAEPGRISNGLVTVRYDEQGHLVSIVDERAGRELIPEGSRANLLQLHEDLPNAWDAWDVDQHYRNTHTDLLEADSVELTETGPLRATLKVVRNFGRSSVVQYISVIADDPAVHLRVELDWQEQEKLLKVLFPLVVHAQHHNAEIQFGHLRRPVNTNTSWDFARFEVMAHRWVQVEEPGYGIAVANAGTYGHDITHHVGTTGEVETHIRLSLVRAARSPDPTQDIGAHRFEFSLHPGADIAAAVRAGYEQNLPLRATPGEATTGTRTLIDLESETVQIEAVKLADDRSGDVIVRLYESGGQRGMATVTPAFSPGQVNEVALTEAPLRADMATARSITRSGDRIRVELRPFQIVTLRLTRP